jgi:hypothetical protein
MPVRSQGQRYAECRRKQTMIVQERWREQVKKQKAPSSANSAIYNYNLQSLHQSVHLRLEDPAYC